MANPFEYVNAINFTKEQLINSEEDAKDYVPFLVNKALSQFQDTIWYAQSMDRYSNIPKKQQFDFLLNIVPKRKRIAKWPKTEESDDVLLVMEYYKYSNEKAKQALTVLTASELAKIRKKLNKGGQNDGDFL